MKWNGSLLNPDVDPQNNPKKTSWVLSCIVYTDRCHVQRFPPCLKCLAAWRYAHHCCGKSSQQKRLFSLGQDGEGSKGPNHGCRTPNSRGFKSAKCQHIPRKPGSPKDPMVQIKLFRCEFYIILRNTPKIISKHLLSSDSTIN